MQGPPRRFDRDGLGRSGSPQHFVLGSVAERVVRHAPCAVLTVPQALLAETLELRLTDRANDEQRVTRRV